MSLDFSKITSTSSSDKLTNPRDIFATLPRKHKDYSYLRDVQGQVLERWFERRNQRELRLKMNTGGGKTMVGLLILKSCLNEEIGPAAYIAPTPYLAAQAIEEAERLGLSYETEPRASGFTRSNSILITSMIKLVNGKSQFGVAPASPEIEIGSLVMDDAHACLGIAEQQFSLVVDKTNGTAYASLLSLFESALNQQSSSRFLEVKSEMPGQFALVPFWAWQSSIAEVEKILFEQKDAENMAFKWPLMRDSLRLCRCFIGAGRVEISSPCLPIGAIPSFSNAKRKVFMSATFADDGVLVTHFDADADEIAEAISPASASDLGERMILVPQELDTRITETDIRGYVVEQAKARNVVVIVPSAYRSQFWANVAAVTVQSANLEATVEAMKKRHVGLVVFVNRYDGIDLPYDACRLLVLDGLPDVRRFVDKWEEGCLHGTSLALKKTVQMIEQGMGRGVRASDDACAVILMGSSLVGQLFNKSGLDLFTPATKAQFDLGEKVGTLVKGSGMGGVEKALDSVFSREPGWVSLAKESVVHAQYETSGADLSLSVARRRAFNSALQGDYKSAAQSLQDARNNCQEPRLRGWLGYQLSELVNFSNAVESQLVLKSAVEQNLQIAMRPMDGIAYTRITHEVKVQADACLAEVKRCFSNGNQLLVEFNSVLEDLQFRPDSYQGFEKALARLAKLIGFESQEPESEWGAGPDVLWALGSLKYLVIECKNEATADTVTKTYCNQLAGSVNWFGSQYDATCSCVPILVHPSPRFEYAATPPAGTKVVSSSCLDSLRESVRQFSIAIGPIFNSATEKEIGQLLAANNLLPQQIETHFTVEPLAAR